MSKAKSDLQKITLNLRPGDFQKMGELFPDLNSSTAIRTLVARFVDTHYKTQPAPKNLDVNLT